MEDYKYHELLYRDPTEKEIQAIFEEHVKPNCDLTFDEWVSSGGSDCCEMIVIGHLF